MGFRQRELRVGDEVHEVIGIALDPEIQPPPSIDPGLPYVAGLVVLLRPEGRVAEINPS